MKDLLKLENEFPNTWWTETKGSLEHQALTLVNTVTLIRQSTKPLQWQNMQNLRLFGGVSALSGLTFGACLAPVTGLAGNYSSGVTGAGIETPAYNLIYSCTETVVSRIIKSKPRPMFLTDGGSYDLQKRAELLQTFSDGIFYETEIYRHSEQVLKNACIFGTGILKIYENTENQIVCQNVFPGDIWVSKLEASGDYPRSMYQTKLMDRFQLIEQYPEHKDELMAVAAYNVPIVNENDIGMTKNLLLVNEGWHLKSGPDAEDGRHRMAVNNVLLLDEEWNLPCFPFVFLRFSKNPIGFWGRGIAELLTGHQMQLNRILRTEAASHNIMSVPRIWIEANSIVNAVGLDNLPGTIGKYVGTPPQAQTWQAVSEDYVAWKEWVIESAYQFLGISQLSSAAQKPAGIDSAVGLRELSDIESDRWTSLGEAWENYYLDAVKLIVRLAREIKGYKVKSSNGDFLKTIKWSDINLKDDDFFLQVYPTSQLPQTPAARKQFVQELAQAQWIDQDTALDLLNLPDLKEFMSLRNAAMERIKQLICQLIEEGIYTPPDELDNLALGIKLFTAAYQRGLTQDIPEDRLKLLRKWIAEAVSKLQPPPPPPPASVPASGENPNNPAPLARGPLPPVSELLPNRK